MKIGQWITIMLLSWAALARADNNEDFTRARRAAMDLGAALKTRLMAAMQEGGPARAIMVCRDEAPVLAEDISAQHELTVRRISERARNPGNRPRDWEIKALGRLAVMRDGGTEPAALEWAEAVVVDHGDTEFRFAKGIVMEPLCLTCHGPAIDPEVERMIRERYPDDLATGYEAGQLRGAFSVVLPKFNME